ncbi:exopolyphosphatase / guanosine-5'-triphosphate,3'-diphosphate pyrophosphatase [Nitratiruptor sp. YY08-26]|uniref:Ppx/GppA phosphatase family protein n=1 Tax=unclassified Nitratiruptor TaxID=2624044 RepID=UPI0019167221|nr:MULTISPECIES: phosphatase [unclassified Nitratiruptor]BCD62162.1 exopolyphosphatase / guanosine-5'-triphosphate,3'-diphosphate pyrophosphatase [Nitratiruptor sp. YY08-13]BCD66098.1 exopolyphosphatase / guanosine-5'-triphosphate,3'-diphosphate pyrophosphatase [Nitratiruptor sp. YY08-26]
MAIGIDIGSNSLRVVKIDCETLKKVAEYEKVVRTAEELASTKKISEAATKRIIDALQEAKEKIRFDEPFKAVATAAFRKANNAKETVEKIRQATGINVEIIDEEQECFYSVQGVSFGLRNAGKDTEKFLMADIGGGSTEIILKHRSRLLFHSFPLGILTTISLYKSREEIVLGIKKQIGAIREFLQDSFEFFGKPKIFVGTGGTPATVAALKLGMEYATYDATKVSGSIINIDDIKEAYHKLIRLDPRKRAKLVGTGREDAIVAGLVILEELCKVAGYSEMVVIDEGVREGVALEMCKIGEN